MSDDSPAAPDRPESTEPDMEFEQASRYRTALPWMRVGARAMALAGFVVLVGGALPEPTVSVIYTGG